MKSIVQILLISLTIFFKVGYCVDFAFYCKCYCPPNSTIVKVKDCSVCNKNLCIEQKLCVFQNSTTTAPTTTTATSNKPRSIQYSEATTTNESNKSDNIYDNVESSLVSYTEYLYSSLLGRVKRDFMFDDQYYSQKLEKRKKEKSEDNNSKKKGSKNKEQKEDDTSETKNNDKESATPVEDNEASKNTTNNENETKKGEEEETVIHIIESGTDNGYQKSEEENWMTECFKRGSIKDETIIILFLGLTGSLLIYAVMKKCFANNYEDGMKYNYQTLNNNVN